MSVILTDFHFAEVLHLPKFLILAGLALASYIGYKITAKLIFDPLGQFPGPFSAKFSNFLHCQSYLSGRQPWNVLKLHKTYGPAVRVAPNELSFCTSQSWKDIYGQRKGHETFIKSEFYDGGNFADSAHSIVSERDPAKHAEMKKWLSNAFSERSLREQEYLVSGVIDEFISQIGKLGRIEPIDMTMWFNLMTFDVIGELAFGKSFGGVNSGKMHFWISVVLESMGQAGLSDFITRFPLVGRLYLKMRPEWMNSLMRGAEKHQSYTMDLVKKRIEMETDRPDFMSRLLEHREEHQMSEIQLAAHASDFVIAGSETTATTLATITYYILKNPHILKAMQTEIRNAFNDYSEIDGTSTNGLKYTHAVCLEALRIFPPLPLGLPRKVPASGDFIDGNFVPGGTIVHTNPYAASLSDENFESPDEFQPERWLGRSDQDVLDASQPFSYGTRSCLGRSLAWLELHTALAKMHFMYDFELVNKDVDWQRDSAMHLLWKKPELFVKVLPKTDEAATT